MDFRRIGSLEVDHWSLSISCEEGSVTAECPKAPLNSPKLLPKLFFFRSFALQKKGKTLEKKKQKIHKKSVSGRDNARERPRKGGKAQGEGGLVNEAREKQKEDSFPQKTQ